MTKQLIPHSKDELQTSGATKRTLYEAAPAHPGATHVAAPGLLAHGVSRTQSNRLLGGEDLALDGKPLAKPLGEVHGSVAVTPIKRAALPGNVEQHSGTRARTFDPQPSLPDNRGEAKK